MCASKVWKARELFQVVFQEWVVLLRTEFGLPVDELLRDDLAERVARLVAERSERALNVESGYALPFRFGADANGRSTLQIGQDPVPIPESIEQDQVTGFIFRAFAERRARNELDDETHLRALDGLLAAADASPAFCLDRTKEEMETVWREVRARARQARRETR